MTVISRSRRLATSLLFMLVAAVLIASVLFLILHSNNSTAQSAIQELKMAADESANVHSYRFTIDAWQTPQVPGDTLYRTSTEGAVVFGEGMHVITTVEGGGYQESLLLKGVQYSRASPNETWQVFGSNFDPNRIPFLNPREHFGLVESLQDARIVSEELLSGVSVKEVRGSVDMLAKAENIWGSVETLPSDVREGILEPRGQFISGSEEFVGWVGVDDGLLHAVELSGTFPAYGELLQFSYWYRAEYSDFNASLSLPSPN